MAKKEAKASKKENNKNKKSFSKDFKAELKKVVWPTPKQLVNNTVAVLTIVLITATIVFVLDLAFESLNKYGIDKIKEVVTSLNEDTDKSIQSNKETSNSTTSDENTVEVENGENVEDTENSENNSENSVQ